MTMTRSDSSIGYDPDGVLDRYLVPFPVFSQDDINAVLVNGIVETPVHGFSVEGLGTEAGVYVRFFTPPPAGQKLVLYRWTKRVQETDYPEGGRFPSKTVEEDFDKLTAMAQEEEDFLQTVVRVPRGAVETPGEYMARFFETAEDAMAARNEAKDAAALAAEAATGASAAAIKAADEASAAAESAAKAAECLIAGAPVGSETQKGIVRLATREEHESGESGIAAQPAYVKEQLLKCGGSPLLSLLWETSTLDKPGFLRANVNHGLITRESFPEAAAEIQRRYDAGDTGVVTETAWQTEFAATGMCAKCSIGDGSTTFRIPFYGVNRASLAVAGGDFGAGEYREDQIRPITGSAAWARFGDSPGQPNDKFEGALQRINDGIARNTGQGNNAHPGQGIVLNSALLGERYSGDITHGPLIGATPFIKMYGTITAASEANLAALIATTTALNGRVEALEITANMSRQVLHVRDEKPNGTHGGSFVQNAWRTRDLNTVVTNTIEGANLANNNICLPAGTYEVSGWAPAYYIAGHRAELFNLTTGTPALRGTNSYNQPSSYTSITVSEFHGIITITEQSMFEVRHRCVNTENNVGFGIAISFGDTEIYTQVFIRRIA